MSDFNINSIELHVHIIEKLYGQLIGATIKYLSKEAPENLKSIETFLSKKFPHLENISEYLKFVLSIAYQIGLIDHGSNNDNDFYYFLNYQRFNEKLFIPIIIYNIGNLTKEKESKKILTLLLNYGMLSETQILTLTKLSPSNFLNSINALLTDSLVEKNSYYHNLYNNSITIYKLNIKNCIKTICLKETKQFLKKELDTIPFNIINILSISEKFTLNLEDVLDTLKEQFKENYVKEEVLGDIIGLQRENNLVSGDFSQNDKFNLGTITYEHKSALQVIIDNIMIEALVQEYGKKVGRVLRYMLKKERYLEEYIISEDCCLPYKETKSILVFLWKREFITKSEISKKKDPYNEQIMYVFIAERKFAYEVLEENIKNSLLKCYKEIEITEDENKIKVLNSCIIDFSTNLMMIEAWKIEEREENIRKQPRRASF